MIVKDKHIIATGYNGTPSGAPHEPHEHSKEECKAIHAEINAIRQADWYKLQGSTIYVTRSPCPICANMIVSARIDKVVFSNSHSTLKESLKIFAEAGIVTHYKPNITYEEV